MSRPGVAITVPNKRPSNGKSARGGKPARGNAGGKKNAGAAKPRRVKPKRGDVRTIESRTDEERAARAKIAARTAKLVAHQEKMARLARIENAARRAKAARDEAQPTASREDAKTAKPAARGERPARGDARPTAARGGADAAENSAEKKPTPRKRPLDVKKRKDEAHPGHRGSAMRIAEVKARLAPAPVGPTPLDVFAIAAPGLAPLVAAECEALGFAPTAVSDAGVLLAVEPDALFLLNARLRIASRVLVRVAEFEARDFATLEKQAARLPWARYVASGMSVRLRVTCRKSRLYHSDAVAERVARGITGAVENVEVGTRAAGDDDDATEGIAERAEQLIVVRLEHDRCTISVDSSGALLHRRGWRQAVAKAPLRETLAAAMLAGCGWHRDMALLDPFCGSGTIGIEAALMARNIAPGLSRAFALESWPGANAAVFAEHRLALRRAVKTSAHAPIVLRDRDAGAIAATIANAERAGVTADIDVARGALTTTSLVEIAPSGLVLTNPPYGMRVSESADLRPLFARLGDVVREGAATNASEAGAWSLGLFMPPEKVLLGQLQMPQDVVFRTNNGGIPVALIKAAVGTVGAKATAPPRQTRK